MSDPLVKWKSLIAVTAGWVSSHDEADAKADCIQDLAAALRESRARVKELEVEIEAVRKELETQCERCGLNIWHNPMPGTTYPPPVVTCSPGVVVTYTPATVTFYPQEVIYTPGELSQYPSKTVGEP